MDENKLHIIKTYSKDLEDGKRVSISPITNHDGAIVKFLNKEGIETSLALSNEALDALIQIHSKSRTINFDIKTKEKFAGTINSLIDKAFILLTKSEVQSGLNRQRAAEGLIEQLPSDHDGRNTWLLNYGVNNAAEYIRKNHEPYPIEWDEEHAAAHSANWHEDQQ